MTQASKSREVKQLIIETVEANRDRKGHSIGISYNKLLERVKKKMFRQFKEEMSPNTFNKYLKELTNVDHALDSSIDPHKRSAVIITVNPEMAKQTLSIQDHVKEIEKILHNFTPSPPFEQLPEEELEKIVAARLKEELEKNPSSKMDEKRMLGLMRYEFAKDRMKQEEPVFRLIRVAYDLFMELIGYPPGTWVRVRDNQNSNGKRIRLVEVDRRTSRSGAT